MDANDAHGSPDNITNVTFAKAAKAENQTQGDAKRETLKLLKKVLGDNKLKVK